MKTLVVDDDATSRLILRKSLIAFGQVDVAVDGKEAVDAVRRAQEEGQPYELICLDIMMPGVDGQAVLNTVRQFEQDMQISTDNAVKVIMTEDVPYIVENDLRGCS